MSMFPVVRVDSTAAEALEPLGTKRKFWLRNASGERMLFKAEERGTGEDWAEKIACELCRELGLPHVHYELAIESGSSTPGVVCSTCAPPPLSLVLGNQLMLARDPDYPVGERYKVGKHTVEAVVETLAKLGPPPGPWRTGLPAGIESALDIFMGYVMLDAWVANQDRHHENWGALREGATLHLAPTFDHGASLARNIRDEERGDRLATRDAGRGIARFARRAQSAFFSRATGDKLTTIEAMCAFARHQSEAHRIWMDQLARIEENAVGQLLGRVPDQRMSAVCREFTLRLLMENHRRILSGDKA